MRRIWRNICAAVAIGAALSSGTSASACAIYTPPQIAIIGQADLAFVGTVTDIRVIGWEGNFGGIPLPYALITFSAVETLKGESQPEWKILRWVNILGSSTRLDPEKTVIVAAFDGTDKMRVLREAGADGGLVAEASAYILQEPACSSAPIFENSAENRAAIELILAQTLDGQ